MKSISGNRQIKDNMTWQVLIPKELAKHRNRIKETRESNQILSPAVKYQIP